MGILSDELFSNPWVNVGMGILGNNQGNYGKLGPALGKGFTQGMNTYAAQQTVMANAAKRAAEKRKLEQEIITENKRQEWVKAGTELPIGSPERNNWMKQGVMQGYMKGSDLTALQGGNSDMMRYIEALKKQKPNMSSAQAMEKWRELGASKTSIDVNTAPERAAAGKLGRLEQATAELEALGKQGKEVMSWWDRAVTQYSPEILQSILRSDAGNQIAAAENGWIQTHGRNESGAAIPDSEWPMWRSTYFPASSDDEYTVAIKRRGRQMVEEGMRIQAGRAQSNPNEVFKEINQWMEKVMEGGKVIKKEQERDLEEGWSDWQ